jgi:hypothetical protein
MYHNSGYFFSKYIDISLSANFRSGKITSPTLFFSSKDLVTSTQFVHFVFQYNFLNTDFMSSIRSKFFKYNVNITSSKKSILKFTLPFHFKKYFFNSSFIVSFPVKNYSDSFAIFNVLKEHIDNNSIQLTRFSVFPIAAYINNIFIPLEYIHFFSLKPFITNILSNNVSFCSFIIINFYIKQIFTFNNTFFRNGNN